MKIPEVTQKNIKGYLKTRRGNDYYFRFPWFDKKHRTMICRVDGALVYSRNRNVHKYLKEDMLVESFKSYQKYLKKWKKEVRVSATDYR